MDSTTLELELRVVVRQQQEVMEQKQQETLEYERPRCKIIIELPFRLFLGKRVRIPKEPGSIGTPKDVP